MNDHPERNDGNLEEAPDTLPPNDAAGYVAISRPLNPWLGPRLARAVFEVVSDPGGSPPKCLPEVTKR
jgi:hypothetical protein